MIYIGSFLAWALTSLFLLVVFIVIAFPYNSLSERILDDLSIAIEGTVTADDWTHLWPLGIKWNNVVMKSRTFPEQRMESLMVWTTISEMFDNEITIHSALMLKRFNGTVELDWAWKSGSLLLVSGRAINVEIDIFDNQTITSGLLNSQYTRVNKQKRHNKYLRPIFAPSPDIHEHWKIHITNLSVIPNHKLFDKRTISIDNIYMTLSCQDNRCEFHDFRGFGPFFEFYGRGWLLRAPIILESRLNVIMELSVTDDPSTLGTSRNRQRSRGTQHLQVHLGGTLKHITTDIHNTTGVSWKSEYKKSPN